MADAIVPHFHNDLGVAVIDIGAREFMCVGAMPPFDHPHVYCDMGAELGMRVSVLFDALSVRPGAQARDSTARSMRP